MSNGASCSAKSSSCWHRARQPLDHRRLTRPGSFPRLGERDNPDRDKPRSYRRGASGSSRSTGSGRTSGSARAPPDRPAPPRRGITSHSDPHGGLADSGRRSTRVAPVWGRRRMRGGPRASGAALRPSLAAGSLQVTPAAQCRECASASLAKCHSNESEQHARAGSGPNKQDGLRAYC
jgi:hypothetical protein